MLNKLFPKYFYNDYNDYIIEQTDIKNLKGEITRTYYCMLYAKYYFGKKIWTYFRIYEVDFIETYDILICDSVDELLKTFHNEINMSLKTYIQPNVSQQPINNNIIKLKLT